MEEQLVSFETAKLAKEKGFSEPIMYAYDNKGNKYSRDSISHDFNIRGLLSAPTQSLLQKWLREVYDLEVHIGLSYTNNKKSGYNTSLFGKTFGNNKYLESKFKTYEEALEVGLLEGLKLVDSQ